MSDARFLKAARLEPTDCTPVWFMRQAGRYMKEYREVRERHGLLQMFKAPELAAEVTLQPIRALGVDAAIVFADILLPLEPMGVRLEFAPGEGPVIHNPVRTLADGEALRVADPAELGYVLETVRLVRRELSRNLPLIGFGGAPFTLASYLIEGGASRNFLATKGVMYSQPRLWDLVMSKLVETLAGYLVGQAREGADIIQLFDSWVGCLAPADYRDYVFPYSRRLLARLRESGIPTIHFGTGSGDLLGLMRQAGGDVLGIDWRTPLDEAWRRVGLDVAVQGNLDPVTLMAPREHLERRAREVLDAAGGRPGHIFNLGHGILPATPVDAVKALVDCVHAYSAAPR
jgi:uroporphyrinogen decarboxylase